MALFVEPHDPRQFELSRKSATQINLQNAKNSTKNGNHPINAESEIGSESAINSNCISNIRKGSIRMRELILDLRFVN